jgi:hypothetical protein
VCLEIRQLFAGFAHEMLHGPGEPSLVGETRDLLEGDNHIIITGENPPADPFAPHHRVLFAHLAEGRIRVSDEFRRIDNFFEAGGGGAPYVVI